MDQRFLILGFVARSVFFVFKRQQIKANGDAYTDQSNRYNDPNDGAFIHEFAH